jgi:1-acyl-sn-glycerol-3-phosphate acyltransferase
MMLRSAVRLEHPSSRELRWLAEDFIFYLPFAGAFFNRIGAVRACQENAERLLKKGSLVAVFPEGIQGIKKLYKDRYHLQRFGRGGFIRLCLRTQTPLVPCAVIGAEETNPMLYRVEYLSKALGLPYVPVTPTFPLLGPLGIVPAPSKWIIQFGEPMRFEGYGPEAADDHVLVGRLSERVRGAIQEMLERGLKGRQSVWFG